MTTHWIPKAERALSGQADADVTVVPGTPPPILDRTGIRAALAPFLAAFMWGSCVLYDQINGPSLGLAALVLRFLAFAMTVRTFLALGTLWSRLRLRNQASAYGLCLTDGGLLLRTPEGDIPVPKEDIVAIKEPGALGDRGGAHKPVYLVTQPSSGRAYVAIPPVFDASPRALAERLMRWAPPPQVPEDFEPPAPSELPSKLYEAAAKGDLGTDNVVIRHGAAWLRRGPYATVLLGLAIAFNYTNLTAEVRDQIGSIAPTVAVVALLFVPALWIGMIRYDIHPRKGLALVLTPAELMMRTRAGVHVVPWSDLKRAGVVERRSWSILRGAHEARSLHIERNEGDSIHYIESFLGAPAEVVSGLCDGYRKGIIRPSVSNSPAA